MSEEGAVRVAAIVDALAPIGDAATGEPVFASEWNVLVGAVTELARLALARERSEEEVLATRFAPAGHEHTGEVSTGWLDPATRDLVEGGRSQRADLQADVTRANEQLAQVSKRLDAVSAEVATLRRRLAGLDDHDLDQSRRLDRLSALGDSIREQDSSVADVRRTLAGLSDRVGEALDLRNQLTDAAGQRIDLAQLRTDVGDLVKVRERLLDASGEVVDARAIERRIERLEQARPGGGPVVGPDLDAFRVGLLDTVDQRLTARTDPLKAGLDAMGGDLTAVRTRLDDQATVLDAARGSIADQQQRITALQAATAGIPDLATRTGALETRVNRQGVTLDAMASLGDRVTASERALSGLATVPGRLAAAEAGLADTRTVLQRFPGVENRLGAVENVRVEVRDLSLRVDAVAATASRAAAAGETNGQRLDTIDARTRDQNVRLDQFESNARADRAKIERIDRAIARPNQPGVLIPDPTVGGSIRFPGDVVRGLQ